MQKTIQKAENSGSQTVTFRGTGKREFGTWKTSFRIHGNRF